MASQPNPASQEPQDAGHVPITEEFASPKHTLQDAAPVIIALLIVAIAVAVIAYVFRATPVASGTIDEAYAVDVPNQSSAMATVQLTFKNLTKKTLTLRNINITVRTDQGEFSDDFANVADFDRYFRAFPELQQHSIEGLAREMKIPPGASVTGSVIVNFPITKESFDKRRALVASLNFYDNRPVEITK
jgi:hypothetical protein